MAMTVQYLPRPDRVTATGVIAPYPVRQFSPVTLAQQTIWPFITGVRGVGPTWQEPQPEEIVEAATKVAKKALSGSLGAARVKINGKTEKVALNSRPATPVAAQVQQAAALITQGEAFSVRSAGRALHVRGDLHRAVLQRNTAYATGSVWDMIKARRRLYRMGGHPGRGHAYGVR
jgi:hypothetical protein